MGLRTPSPTASADVGPISSAGPGGPGTAPPEPGTPRPTALPAPLRAGWRRLRRDRRLGIAVAGAAVAGWAWATGVWLGRGPLTSEQALWSLTVSIAVGALAGFAVRSRWAMLGAPLLFIVVVELVRLDLDGPTVDRVGFSSYGLLALAVGRGFHALVSWLPMAWAAALGAGLARWCDARTTDPRTTDPRTIDPRTTDPRTIDTRTIDTAPLATGPVDAGLPSPRPARRLGRYGRRTVAVATGVALLGLSLAIARPDRTDRITGADGKTLPGSVAELRRVDVHGRSLAVMVRGRSRRNPVLLFLAGGPGGSELGAMRRHLPDLERHFVVATLDQRGAGKSYRELDPTGTVTLDGAVADAVAVTDHLRRSFGQDRILLVGQSWGSILGALTVQRHPERYRAFVGVGQMVSPRATDRVFYRDTLAWARSRGDDGLARRLEAIGPPPYDDMLDYETALSHEHEVYPYDHGPNSEGEGGFSENLMVEEYSLVEQVHLLGAFMDTFAALYPRIQEVDLRATATRLEVPVFFVQGAHEAPGRARPFEDWYAALDAPLKGRATFATSGHRPLFEQPDEFVAYMTDVVLTRTSGPDDATVR